MQYECYIISYAKADIVYACCNKLQVAHKEALAIKRGIEAAKQQTLNEASKELLALVDEGDRGYSAEDDDDDDDSLCTPKRLPSPIPMENKERNSTSETNTNNISSLSSGLSDGEFNLPVRQHFTTPTAPPPRRAFSAHYSGDFSNTDSPLMSRSMSLPVQGYYGDQWPLSYSSYGGQLPARSPTPSSDISSYSHLYSGRDVSMQHCSDLSKAFMVTTCR